MKNFIITAMRFLCLGGLVFGGLAQAQEEDRLVGLIEPLKAEKPFTIGVTVVHLHDDFYKGIVYGITDEAKRAGVNVLQVSVAGAYGNVREQFAQLESIKNLKADIAVLAPAAYDGYDPIIKSLKSAGMKVASVGIPVNSPNVDFGVLQDDRSIGSALAKAVCNSGADKKTVATIPGPAGAEWVRLRYVGFTEAASKCNSMTVLDGSFGGELGLQAGLTRASDLLLRNRDINFIYTPEISLGMGAAQAVRQQNRKVSVVSSSMVRQAVPMIKDGRMLAVVSEPGIIMGRLIVQYAIREMENKPLPNLEAASEDGLGYPHFNVPPTLITPKNVDTHPFQIYEIPPKSWKVPALQ
ncbi:substrate-binding domain-containing protein [Alloalcanivorax marinus]|uniref:substrate-binding domain-containing protein n=1 Tax=Alloalcanivorax marinus TaxID=1177169 RepID=UPI001931775A|nr:substrate-binding domain-containing protein [Alloalcanivorax marinus]MBL7251097.1 substrate-binding domain-containing protein [Alloalcanivorax marinus]